MVELKEIKSVFRPLSDDDGGNDEPETLPPDELDDEDEDDDSDSDEEEEETDGDKDYGGGNE